MKRLSRLTALLLAIMMLCTMVASAETGGVSVENWTFGDYQKAVEAASEVPAEEGMDDPWGLVGECGDDNIYCGYAKELIALGTAQERYDRMMELYNDPEDSVALEMTMAHYYGIEEHNASGVLCTCNFPAYEPEYVPGDISLHEETCPWHFKNLSTAEQFEVVTAVETAKQPMYMAQLSPEQSVELETYSLMRNGPVLSAPCSEDNEYCAMVTHLVENCPTAQDRYDYMMSLYSEDADNVDLEGAMLHYVYYMDEHQAAGLICECNFPSIEPEYVPGDISLHEETCPWHFVNLSTAEQCDVVMTLETEEKPAYDAKLTAVKGTGAANALHNYFVSHHSSCSDPDCEYAAFAALPDGFARYEQLVEWYNISDGYLFNKYYVFLKHVWLNHADSDKMCWCVSFNPDTHMYGSIAHNDGRSFTGMEIECPWHFKNLTVEEQYMVFVGLSQEEKEEYFATLTDDQRDALSNYIMNGGVDKEDKLEIVSGSVALNITVATGTFANDYEMRVGPAQLTEAQMAAVRAQGIADDGVLGTFDVAFIDAESGTGAMLTPVEGKYVEMRFGLNGTTVEQEVLQIYMLKDNGDGTFTAVEKVAPVIVDKTSATLTIRVEATEFSSAWVVGGRMMKEEEKPVEVVTTEEGTFLMCDGEELAIVNANGYVIDLATGIAVGTYNAKDGLELGVN